MEITKEMKIADVLAIDPNTAEIFMGFGMHCYACPMGSQETLEEASMVHGIELQDLLEALNKFVNEK